MVAPSFRQSLRIFVHAFNSCASNTTPFASGMTQIIVLSGWVIELLVTSDMLYGDFGAIMREKSINGKWQVVFSEFYTGRDIADIMVNEEDLKVHKYIKR